MNLHTLVERYIALQQALGKPFVATARRLRSFVRTFGPDVAIADVTREQVGTFLTKGGPLTRNYHVKHSSLRGFYRYAQSRGYLDAIPLPAPAAKLPPPFQPYIYSHEELRRLLATIDRPRRSRSCLEPITMRTVVLLLYGAGLRIGEALALDHQDVDLEHSLLTVRASKCFKSRLVPVAATLSRALSDYAKRPSRDPLGGQSSFFTTRSGGRVRSKAVQGYFRRVCERAGVRRGDGARLQPRLHDLRHNAACRIMPTRFAGCDEVRRTARFLRRHKRHNQRPSRKANSSSSGRNRPGCTPNGVILPSASSFRRKSACRYIWVVSTDSCPSHSAMTERSTPC
jgi:integrase/recombinase XerD